MLSLQRTASSIKARKDKQPEVAGLARHGPHSALPCVILFRATHTPHAVTNQNNARLHIIARKSLKYHNKLGILTINLKFKKKSLECIPHLISLYLCIFLVKI